MNKYQEALDELSFPLYDSSCGGCKCGTSDCQDCEKAQAVFTLQELVEKATSKKPIEQRTWTYDEIPYTILCPNCKENLGYEAKRLYKHCPTCGQALDWSEEE